MADPAVVRPFRGVSAADRMSQRRGALLEAGLSALADATLNSVTVDEIITRAGLSKRYFYEHFRTKDALFVALVDQLIAQLTDSIASLPLNSGQSLAERLESAVLSIVSVLVEDPRNTRLFVETISSDQLTGTVNRTEHQIAAMIVDVALADAKVTASDQMRLNTAGLILVSGTARALTDWLNGSIGLPLNEFVELLVHIAIAAIHTIRPDL